MALEKLLTMDEAADILSVTKKTLLSHVREGRIRYINIGNGAERESRRFRPSDIEVFIRDQSRVCLPVNRRTGTAKRRKSTNLTSSMPDDDVGVLLAQQHGGIRGLLAKQQRKQT